MKKAIFRAAAFGVLLIIGLLQAEAVTFKIIVNNANTKSSLSKAQVSKLLLKKTTKWNDGTKALPVDQPAGAAVRIDFSKEILGKSVSSVKNYWQKLIFSGRAVPPPVKASDAEVVAFVKANPGAVGYVSASTSVDGVKVLKIKD